MLNDTPHRTPLIIGHRGASQDAPENTLESFRRAWDQGADGIEADFRLTADGHIVCMHDETTTRTTGVDMNITATNLKELRSLDAGLWKGVSWTGTMIPTLDEVLAALPHNSWFFIEIKSGPEIITHLKRILQESKVSTERIRLLSFSAQLITDLKQRMPDWHACWLCDYRHTLRNKAWYSSPAEVLKTIMHTSADGLASANHAFLDQNMVDRLRELGKEIHVWTVDRFPAAQQLCTLGVDSIMTNRPGWLRQKLSQSEYRP